MNAFAGRITSHYFRALFDKLTTHTRIIYGKSCLSRIIKTNFFLLLHSKKDGCLLLEICHVNVADVLVLVLIVLNVFRAC